MVLLTLGVCGGLIKNNPYGLICLNTHSQVNKISWVGLRCVALLKKKWNLRGLGFKTSNVSHDVISCTLSSA